MKLYNFLKPELIRINCQESNTEDLLREMVHLLKLENAISNENLILKKLINLLWNNNKMTLRKRAQIPGFSDFGIAMAVMLITLLILVFMSNLQEAKKETFTFCRC